MDATASTSEALPGAYRTANDNRLSADLFEYAGIALQIHVVAAHIDDVRECKRSTGQKIFLVYSKNHNIIPKKGTVGRLLLNACQLNLNYFMNDAPQNTVNFAKYVDAKSAQGALDRELKNFFRDIRGVRNIISQLYRNDIKYLGDFIALSEQDMMSYAGMDQKKLEDMKNRMAIYKFTFGMKVLGWKKPTEHFGSLLR